MKQTQCDRLLDYLKKRGSITKLDCWHELGILNGGGRAWDLKEAGYPIVTEMITVKNRWGESCRIALYVLKENHAQSHPIL